MSPPTLPRLLEVDAIAGDIVNVYRDEIRHVGVGSRWHEHWCLANHHDPRQHFTGVVQQWFGEQLRRPSHLTKPVGVPQVSRKPSRFSARSKRTDTNLKQRRIMTPPLFQG